MTPPPDDPRPTTRRDPNQPAARGTRSTGYVQSPGAPVVDWTPTGDALPTGTAAAPAGSKAVPAAAPKKAPAPAAPAAVPFPPDDLKAACDAWCAKYPRREAAILPVLHLAQKKYGWVSPALEAGVAKYLGVSDAHVRGVVSFYTMFLTKPPGRHHVEVCRTLSCALRGAPALTRTVGEVSGCQPGETSKDGRYSLVEVECIGLCEVAPAIFVDGKPKGNVTAEGLRSLLQGLA